MATLWKLARDTEILGCGPASNTSSFSPRDWEPGKGNTVWRTETPVDLDIFSPLNLDVGGQKTCLKSQIEPPT